MTTAAIKHAEHTLARYGRVRAERWDNGIWAVELWNGIKTVRLFYRGGVAEVTRAVMMMRSLARVGCLIWAPRFGGEALAV